MDVRFLDGHGVVFVSGIDTGVGKTFVTGEMARLAIERGRDAITVKMVQTGNVGRSEDIDMHRRIMGVSNFPEDDEGLTVPQMFAFPGSGHLAARLEGRRVNLLRITRSVEECARRRDLVLVESAGGLFVPLTASTLTIDYLAERGWPLVLVTNGRLGSINHTLMSIDVARSRGIRLIAVVYDWLPNVDPVIDKDTPSAIRAYLKKLNMRVPFVFCPRIADGLSRS